MHLLLLTSGCGCGCIFDKKCFYFKTFSGCKLKVTDRTLGIAQRFLLWSLKAQGAIKDNLFVRNKEQKLIIKYV